MLGNEFHRENLGLIRIRICKQNDEIATRIILQWFSKETNLKSIRNAQTRWQAMLQLHLSDQQF